MVKPLGIIFILLFAFNTVYAANVTENISQDKGVFEITFSKGYSNLTILNSKNSVIINFETSEQLQYKREFFDLPIKEAYITENSYRKKLIIVFENEFIEPVVFKEDKLLRFTFPFPNPVDLGQNIEEADVPSGAKAPTVPGAGAYFKMLFGLSVVLFIILLVYWLVKSYYKKQIFTDIPGSGRLLGKVDIDIRKSLAFYELGETLYIIGITDNGMNLIDKITDEAEATKIRAGFTRKREFTGYMSFFKRKNELDDEISTSNALVEEKLKSLRKK